MSVDGSDRTTMGVGTLLSGRYRLDALLGAGGMGRVFRGYHLELKAPIAVKVMHEVLSFDPELARRFEREARAAMMLSHPNVVRVLDLGQDGDTRYIVMELIEGVSLGALLDRYPARRFPIEATIDILAQTADALAAAHDKGLVHRDLKPDNVLVSEAGGSRRARVVDFGLVKMADPESGGTLTQADQVAGTPAYMSPEQCRSLSVGPPADLYALGCILHEMLSGAPPFAGGTAIDVIARQMYLPPPAVERDASAEPVPPDLEALRKELLRKSPDDRPQGAIEVAARLRACRGATSSPGPTGPVRGSRPPRGEAFPSLPAPTEPIRVDPAAPLRMGVLRVPSATHAPGLGDDLILGLGAQGLVALTVDAVDAALPEGPLASSLELAVVDGGADVGATLTTLHALASRAPALPRMAVLTSFSNVDLSRLIEAGAGDVVRANVDAVTFAKKARRLAARRAR